MFRKRTGFDPHTHAYIIICNFIYSCIQGEGIEYFVNEAISIPRFPIPELHVCYSRPRFTGTQGVCVYLCECIYVFVCVCIHTGIPPPSCMCVIVALTLLGPQVCVCV